MSTKRRPSAATGMEFLEELAQHPDGMGLTDLSDKLGVDAGHAHRILATLAEGGWVSHTNRNEPYRITGKLLRVAGNFLSRVTFSEVAAPVVKELGDSIGETVGVFELHEDELTCVYRVLARSSVGVFVNIGASVPIRGTAVGRAVEAARVKQGIEPTLDPAAPSTEVDAEVLDAIRLGYADADGTYRPGIRAVAAAIQNLEGRVAGAVSVVGPSDRITDARVRDLGPLLVLASLEISRSLGAGDNGEDAPVSDIVPPAYDSPGSA